VPVLQRLVPEALEDDPGWPLEEIAVPATVLLDSAFIASDTTEAGVLRLRKAAVPLGERLKDRNAIWVLDGKGNPIASYSVRELPLPGYSTLLDFMHGELELAFPGLDALVPNDRKKLIGSTTTQAILDWVAGAIWKQVQTIDKALRDSARRANLETASILNDQLNEHAKRSLEELQTEILVDLVEDPESGGSGGGTGGGGGGGGGHGTGTGSGAGGKSERGTREIPGAAERVRRARFPQVLLSGYDPNPALDGADTKRLTERHPPLDQDDDDKEYNVLWINTEHAFAKATMARGGPEGAPFKSYQLHMFRDVVQREALRYRQRRDAELSLDRVENELSDVSNRFLAELPRDLVDHLLGPRSD